LPLNQIGGGGNDDCPGIVSLYDFGRNLRPPGKPGGGGPVVSRKNLKAVAAGNRPHDDSYHQSFFIELVREGPELLWSVWLEANVCCEEWTELIQWDITDAGICSGRCFPV